MACLVLGSSIQERLESPEKDHEDDEPLLGGEVETVGAVQSGKEKAAQRDLISVCKLKLYDCI